VKRQTCAWFTAGEGDGKTTTRGAGKKGVGVVRRKARGRGDLFGRRAEPHTTEPKEK